MYVKMLTVYCELTITNNKLHMYISMANKLMLVYLHGFVTSALMSVMRPPVSMEKR